MGYNNQQNSLGLQYFTELTNKITYFGLKEFMGKKIHEKILCLQIARTDTVY